MLLNVLVFNFFVLALCACLWKLGVTALSHGLRFFTWILVLLAVQYLYMYDVVVSLHSAAIPCTPPAPFLHGSFEGSSLVNILSLFLVFSTGALSLTS